MIVYADAAATTKLSKAAADVMQPLLFDQLYGNPSSSHFIGSVVRDGIESARKTIAECINAEPEEIYFTSGGSEADNWAMKMGYPYHRLVSSIEHHAILRCMEDKDDLFLPVSSSGIVTEIWSHSPYFSGIGFVSVMLANNEIGTIQPIKEIAALCQSRNILFHTDAVQAVGHIPVDVKDLGVDMLSASAHKFHGPKGVGFLYVRKDVPMVPLIYGGHQERGFRAGTENVPGIMGMAAALRDAVDHMPVNTKHIVAMRDKLIGGLLQIPGCILNGHIERRLPGIVNVCFDGVDGETLVALLSERGIMASSGSACMSGAREPSHVLMAIGRTEEQAKSALRLSIDETNTEEEIDYILKTIPDAVSYLRAIMPRP